MNTYEYTITPNIENHKAVFRKKTKTYRMFVITDFIICVFSALVYLGNRNAYASIYMVLTLWLFLLHSALYLHMKSSPDITACYLKLTEKKLEGISVINGRHYQQFSILYTDMERVSETEIMGFVVKLKAQTKDSFIIEQNTKKRDSRYMLVSGTGYSLPEFKSFYGKLKEIIPKGINNEGCFWKEEGKKVSIFNLILPAATTIPGCMLYLLLSIF